VDPLLVRACRREPVERTPVWFMRQAGRSLPEYRELRKQYGLFDIVARPDVCAEVTLQPVRRHDVDAAVMFTDIMFPVLGMGVDVQLVENVGPVIARPIRTRGSWFPRRRSRCRRSSRPYASCARTSEMTRR
jgi:uroporphyrinogen decarboxylase